MLDGFVASMAAHMAGQPGLVVAFVDCSVTMDSKWAVGHALVVAAAKPSSWLYDVTQP